MAAREMPAHNPATRPIGNIVGAVVVRHMAANLLHQAKPTTSLKNRRKRAGWNTAYLESLIQQTA
jgi:hypothetical protein